MFLSPSLTSLLHEGERPRDGCPRGRGFADENPVYFAFFTLLWGKEEEEEKKGRETRGLSEDGHHDYSCPISCFVLKISLFSSALLHLGHRLLLYTASFPCVLVGQSYFEDMACSRYHGRIGEGGEGRGLGDGSGRQGGVKSRRLPFLHGGRPG